MDSWNEALERLRRAPDTVAPDQAYVVEPFSPGDGEGVAELFYRTYGGSYPIKMYYVPDDIRRACARGSLHPVVARLAGGEIVGFASLYRSSPPFEGLVELGLGMVHPAYRGSFILFHLFNALTALMNRLTGIEAAFGEAVCDTIITQHASALFGFKECALELDLMPGSASGRVACLVMFRNLRDRRRALFVPERFAPEIGALAARLGLDREPLPAKEVLPDHGVSLADARVFTFAGLLRGSLSKAGADCRERLEEEERSALAAGCRRFQWFLNLGDPGAGAAAAILQGMGYGISGLVPRWFDDDALLMHKLLDPPSVQGVTLYSDAARDILSMALREGCPASPGAA
jgi:hypothetical protein